MTKDTKPARTAADWERIERDYRAGVLSVREIAATAGISHTAIQKRAKAEGWERDLKAKVQARADALVAKREVAKSVAAATAVTERVIIEANAQVIAEVRSNHRVDIARARRLCMTLLAELEEQTANVPGLEGLGELLRSENDKGVDKLNDVYRAVISLPERTKTMKALADSIKVLVGLEREAYGLETTAGANTSVSAADVLAEIAANLPD
jgi:hypothetical protein